MDRRSGFTLIELLIVVAIIAILAAIAVPNFLEAQTRSKISRAKADMRSVVTGLESYRVDNNRYPPMSDSGPLSTWALWQDIGSGGDDHSRVPSYLTTPIAYITSIPYDPFIPYSTLTGAAHVVAIGKRYVYYNWDQFLDTYATASYQARAKDCGSWLMYSYGPDRDPFNGPANAVYINYDSTNGTVSYGNIFRTQRVTDKYEQKL